MKHRSWSRLAALSLLVALAATACAGDGTVDEDVSGAGAEQEDTDDGASSGEDGEDPTYSGEEAMDGGTLRVVVPTEPPTMNPVYSVISDGRVWGAMFDRLIDVGDDLQPTDTGLVTSWTRDSDLDWTFTVREGVTFHNGEPFNAEALAFTILQNRDEETAKLKSYFSVVESIDVVDDVTVKVTTGVPYIALPQLLSTVFAVPPSYYAEVGGEAFAQEPIGTGPFELVDYQAGQRVDVAAFGDYWRGTPSLDGIEFTFAPEAESRVSLLQSDGADLVADVPVELSEQVASTPGLELAARPSLFQMTVFYNITRPPFDDPDLRRAASMAIDPAALVDGLFNGDGAELEPLLIGQLMSERPTYDDAIGYDLAGAQAMVEEHDFPEFDLNYTVGRYPQDSRVGEAIAGMFEAAGLKINRNPLEAARFFELRGEGALDMWVYQILPVFVHPDVYVNGFLTTDSITKNCIDTRFDELAVEALQAEDQTASEAVYQEIEHLALYDLVCNVPLYEVVDAWGATEQVVGFEAPQLVVPRWDLIGLAG